MTAQNSYYCGKAERQLGLVLNLLKRKNVFVGSLHGSIERTFITRCGPCAANSGQSACTGWRLVVPKDKPLVLGPFSDHKRAVNIRLCVQHDYRRSAPAPTVDWENYPLAEANVTVEVWDVSSKDAGVSRHHVDLANLDQHGTVWHLQANGNGFSDTRLDMPRWVTPPMDLVMALDFVLFNYSHDRWMELQKDGTYTKSVMESEELILKGWSQKVAAMFDPRHQSKRMPFLRMLDNEKLDGWEPLWNPRPA